MSPSCANGLHDFVTVISGFRISVVQVAVSVTVMFETWPDDSAPSYSVQTSHLKKGTVDHAAKAWSTYGGRVGVWRIMEVLTRYGIATVNYGTSSGLPDAELGENLSIDGLVKTAEVYARAAMNVCEVVS